MSSTSPPSTGGAPPAPPEAGPDSTTTAPRRSPGDLLAGAIFVAFGLAFALGGRTYDLGTTEQPGSGLFPVGVGLLMIALGVAVAVVGLRGTEYSEGPTRVPWRGMVFVLGSLLAFAVLAPLYGLLPATAVTGFLASLASPGTTLVRAGLTAAGITVGAYVIFALLLQLPIPVFTLPVV